MRRHLGMFAMGVVLTGVAGSAVGSQPAPTLLDRAFTVVAEAYPTEPAPGSQTQPISIRPHSSRTQAVNPPATGYARAAQVDLGLAEGYLGSQGPNAEADTSAEGGRHDVAVDDGGSHLEARVTEAPSAEATAEASAGGPTGSLRSSASSGIVDDALVATAHAEVQRFTIGPIVVGGGRFDAEVRVDGTPDGASGEGRVVLHDVTVNGIPVVIDDEGVRVDTLEVPAPFVDDVTDQLQQFLSQGGYADVRVVQPRVTVAEDGSSAEVSGGGVLLYVNTNDPTNLYFVQLTLLGGRAFAAIGTEFDVVGPPVAPPAAPAAAPPTAPSQSGSGPVPAAPPSAGEADLPVVLAYAEGDGRATLRGIWSGWPWVIGGAAALIGAFAAAMRNNKARRRIDAFRDEYLRG